MKHRVICPTVDINEGVCKDLGSHKGEHGQQENLLALVCSSTLLT